MKNKRKKKKKENKIMKKNLYKKFKTKYSEENDKIYEKICIV